MGKWGLGRTYTVRGALGQEELEAVRRVRLEVDWLKGDLSDLGYSLGDMHSAHVNCPFTKTKYFFHEFVKGEEAFTRLWEEVDRIGKAVAGAEKLLDTEYTEYGPTIDKLMDKVFGNKAKRVKSKYALELQAIPVYPLLRKMVDVKLDLSAAEKYIRDVPDNDAMYGTTVKCLEKAIGLKNSYRSMDEALVAASKTFDESLWNDKSFSSSGDARKAVAEGFVQSDSVG